jgi:Kef-type K+ transport system membrane component KefB
MNNFVRAEGVFASWTRNLIIIFTLGISMLSLTKKKKTETYVIVFILLFIGLCIGSTATYDYYKRTSKFTEKQIAKYRTNNIFIVFVIIVLMFSIYLIKIITKKDM